MWHLKNHIDLMFMDLFNVEKLKEGDNKYPTAKKGQYDTSQYDALAERITKLTPEDAAKLILRTDDDVDYNDAWDVLRDMITSDQYKEEVLNCIPR